MSRAANEIQDDKESLKHESLFFMALKTLKQQLERERLEHEQQLSENQRKTLLVHFLQAQRCTKHNWIQLGQGAIPAWVHSVNYCVRLLHCNAALADHC